MPKGCNGESRLQQLRRLDEPVDAPELGVERYLLEAMFRLGPIRATGLGPESPTWSEIDAFARRTRRISEPWEAEALYDMCAGYVSAFVAGENPLEMSPMEIEEAE